MSNKPLSILQVCTFDRWGGAEAVAAGLAQQMRSRGCETRMAVGWERGGVAPPVIEMPRERSSNLWAGAIRKTAHMFGAHRMSPLVDRVASPGRMIDWFVGRESFRFPSTQNLVSGFGPKLDILHLHNLHGGYFDLGQLPALSKQVPVVLTLHDTWMLSGHCAYALGCGRWRDGCGHCPDLSIYPPLRRDGTASNWERKKEIYDQSRLRVATPSRWLMDQVDQSMLKPGVIESRVIPYGIDLSTFHPGNKQMARDTLGIDRNQVVLLSAAAGLRKNLFKDYKTLRDAVEQLGMQTEVDVSNVVLIALGDDGPSQRLGAIEVRFVPFETRPDRVACFYQAADLYLHTARADTFPCVVLEALACGTPVIATAVGGVPEQVKTLGEPPAENTEHARAYEVGQATGLLTPPGDSAAFAVAVSRLIADSDIREQLAGNAARDAVARFDPDRHVDDYMNWYLQIIEEDSCVKGDR